MSNKFVYKVEKFENNIIFLADKFENTNSSIITLVDPNDEKYKNSLGYQILKAKDSVERIDIDGYLIHYVWTGTYQHWIMDIIYLFYDYIQLNKKYPELKMIFLIRGIIYDPFVMNTLKFLFGEDVIEQKTVILKVNNIYMIKNLFLPYVNYLTQYNHFHCNDYPEDHKFIINLLIEKAKPFSKNDYPKKIYLSRRNLKNHWHNRILINEDEVAELMIQNGYTEIFSNELDFTDEINLFNNVEKVVTPIGAGCANAIFSNESQWITIGSKVYNYHPVAFYVNHDYFGNRAFSFAETEMDVDLSNIEIHDNLPYKCNIEKLKLFLKDKNFI